MRGGGRPITTLSVRRPRAPVMEPIVASTVSHVIRPAAASVKADLAAVLKDGRILAGEVLKSPGDGQVMIAIGRFKVPAETNLQLEPGQHFLFRVEMLAGGALLHLLGYGDPEEAALLAALRKVVGEERPVGELLGDLAARIRAEMAQPGSAMDRLRTLLQGLGTHVALPEGGGEELTGLLARSGLRYEAALLLAARGGLLPGLLEQLGADLKGQLLAALADLPEGELRDAVAKALSGLEAEQLLNLARQRAGEALVWSFPFPDAEGWTTARLLVPPRSDDEGDKDGEGEGESTRIVLGVDFSALGPVRIDLLRSEHLLSVRLLCASEEVAARIRADYGTLVELLETGERPVNVFARQGTPNEVSVSAHTLDISFLREHHLMDVSG